MPRSHSATASNLAPVFRVRRAPFFAPFAAAPVVLAPSSPRRTMAAMVDLLLRRAPAASGEVYDVLRGRRIVGRIMLSNGSAASQWVWTLLLPLPQGPHSDTRLRAYPRRCHEGVLPQLASGMKRTRHKRVPSPRRRALEFIAAHPDGCTEALLAAENIPADILIELIQSGLVIARNERLEDEDGAVETMRVWITEAGERVLGGAINSSHDV